MLIFQTGGTLHRTGVKCTLLVFQARGGVTAYISDRGCTAYISGRGYTAYISGRGVHCLYNRKGDTLLIFQEGGYAAYISGRGIRCLYFRQGVHPVLILKEGGRSTACISGRGFIA